VQHPGGRSVTRLRKPVIPVQLVPIPRDGGVDLAGLEQIQQFLDSDGRAFSERTGGHLKDRFVDELVAKMLTRLTRLFP
jgi:hypothetical protein